MNRSASQKPRIHYTFPCCIVVRFTDSLKIINREEVLLGIISWPAGRSNSAWLYTLRNKDIQEWLHQSSLCAMDRGLTAGNHPSVCLQLGKAFSVSWGRETGKISWSRLSELWLQHTEISPWGRRKYLSSFSCSVLGAHYSQGEKMSIYVGTLGSPH